MESHKNFLHLPPNLAGCAKGDARDSSVAMPRIGMDTGLWVGGTSMVCLRPFQLGPDIRNRAPVDTYLYLKDADMIGSSLTALCFCWGSLGA